jgi:exopolysaccharide biosynthesis protein
MKTLKVPFVYGLVMAVLITTVSAFVMLDAFVIARGTKIIDNEPIPCECETDTEVIKSIDVTDTSYSSVGTQTTVYKSISIEIYEKYEATIYVAEVKLSSPLFFRTALANDTYGRNIKQYPSVMATNKKAIFAINGDFYGYRDVGLVIRNGTFFRDVPRSAPDNIALIMDKDGNLRLHTEGSVDGETLVEQGITQGWSFGPVLVNNGVAVDTSNQKWVSGSDNPRTAIGQIGPLHYLFVVVDGRSTASRGVNLSELTQIFLDHGAQIAYNLDGGGTATMWFNGSLTNKPTYDGTGVYQRGTSDILYITGDTE